MPIPTATQRCEQHRQTFLLFDFDIRDLDFCNIQNTAGVVTNDVQVRAAEGFHHVPIPWPWPTRWA